MVHVGVDLHKRSSQLAGLMPDGEVTQQRLENDPTQLEQFFAQIPRGSRIANEPSGTWWWFVDLVERLGHHAVLSNPKQTKAIAAARLKNDRVDAERLALFLRGDLLPTVWIPPAGLREARELVRHRVSFVWDRTEIKNRLLAPDLIDHLGQASGQGHAGDLPGPHTTARTMALAWPMLVDDGPRVGLPVSRRTPAPGIRSISRRRCDMTRRSPLDSCVRAD